MMTQTRPAATRPSRHLPKRAAKTQRPAAGPIAATKTNNGRVTRSSAKLDSPASSPDDDDEEDNQDLRSTSALQRHRLKRPGSVVSGNRKSKRTRHRLGYYDESSDEDEDSGAYLTSAPDDEAEPPTPPSITPSKHRRPKTERAPLTLGTKRTSPKGASKRGSPVADATELAVPPPPWVELPYFVLLEIFQNAVPDPLDWASVRWLLGMSRLCHAFAEPALTVLYKTPPLFSPAIAHRLLHMLSSQPDTALFNYRQKIESLEIDVESVLAKTYRGHQLDLAALVRQLPRLTKINLWHQKDNPPYRALDDNLKWEYPPGLFQDLGVPSQPNGEVDRDSEAETTFPRLRNFRWSARMLGYGSLQMNPLNTLDRILAIHSTPGFSGLRKVCFVNFQLPSLHAATPDEPRWIESDKRFIERFGKCICVLSELTHLVFESSTAANGQLLPMLPKTISCLDLINCWDVKAEDFAEYLLSHGYGLRHLALHHNQSLSLAFLPVLGVACPNLESLSMNLTYFKHHEFYRDSDPCYDTLLSASQTPIWPPALQHLELKNLRKWEADAAENFFQSLVDSAADLPMLRHLDIKAMLDIPFRQRSQMRDKWVAKLNDVFLRKWVEPLPYSSLQSKAHEHPPEMGTPTKSKRKSGPGASPTRRSHRIATQVSVPTSRASSIGRDLRVAGMRPSYAEPDTDVDFDSFDDGGDDDAGHQPTVPRYEPLPSKTEVRPQFIQGMCHVVDIRFDNQKPAENQWHMEDFLDSESDDPSDTDWNGDREVDEGYAW